MLHPLDDEIQACSNNELLRIHRSAILNNYKGRLNYRIAAITAEIEKRVATSQKELERVKKVREGLEDAASKMLGNNYGRHS
ncbi:MAG: hypothetical protein OXC79_00660, partial [Candidatus Poribacteria bacterium]|nr:hypothetical protein [Candidatus Poribacteria bacterium]